MGRKKVPIDWKKVDMMLEAHCTGSEVAAQFGIHYETLARRTKEEFNLEFVAYASQKKEKGKAHLKVKQLQAALGGDRTLLIWLGKNWLGQRELPQQNKEFDGKLSILLDRLLAVESPEDFNDKDKESSDKVEKS